MNTLKALTLATLMSASLAAQAGERENLAYRFMVEAGHLIANQGNNALREIRTDFKQDVTRQIAQWLPKSAEAKASTVQPVQLNEYVQMHQQALAQ